MAGDVAEGRRDGAPIRIVRHRARVPPARGSLQGVGAGETVRAEAAAPPVGPRLELPGPHSIRHLAALPLCFGEQLAAGFDAHRVARGQVYDLELDGIELERRFRAQRVERHLQVAGPAREGPAGLVVDDPPAPGRAIDAVDDAVERPAIDGDSERLLEVLRPSVEATLFAKSFELGGAIALERRFATSVWKRDLGANLTVERPQHRCGDVCAVAPRLSGAPQRFVQDHALDGLGA